LPPEYKKEPPNLKEKVLMNFPLSDYLLPVRLCPKTFVGTDAVWAGTSAQES
jgi:hypothetical protein